MCFPVHADVKTCQVSWHNQIQHYPITTKQASLSSSIVHGGGKRRLVMLHREARSLNARSCNYPLLARYRNQLGEATMQTLGKIAATLGVIGAIAVGSAAPAAAWYHHRYYHHHYGYYHHHHYGYHHRHLYAYHPYYHHRYYHRHYWY